MNRRNAGLTPITPLVMSDPTGLQAGGRVYVRREGDWNHYVMARSRPAGFTAVRSTRTEYGRDGFTYQINKNGIVGVGMWNTQNQQMALPGIPKDRHDGNPLSPETATSNPLETAANVLAATNQLIKDTVYNVSPDYCSVGGSIPIIGGIGLKVSKDIDAFGSYSKDAPSDASGLVEMVQKGHLSIGISASCSYFFGNRPETQDDRIKDIEGNDLTLKGGVPGLSIPLEEGHPMSASAALPFELGGDVSVTRKLAPIGKMISEGRIFDEPR